MGPSEEQKTTRANLLLYFFIAACSEKLKKCFVISHLPGEDVSWNIFKSQWCEKQNVSVGTIHSEYEQEFLSVFLEHMLGWYFTNVPSAYIGNGGCKFVNVVNSCILLFA